MKGYGKIAAMAAILVMGMTSSILAGGGTAIDHARAMDGKIYVTTGVKASTDPPGVIIGARAQDPIPGNLGKLLNAPRLILPVTRKDAATIKDIAYGTRFKVTFVKEALDGLKDSDATHLSLTILN